MPRTLIIADDLTGAAELAGIAARLGHSVRLLRTPAPPPVAGDVVVYDTDSRLQSPDAAADTAARFARSAHAGAFDLIYKKVDSVLRGQPYAETAAVARVFARSGVLMLPHNPSRGRRVTGGRYHVGGIPLHQTEFAADPTHPATTDDVIALLRAPAGECASCAAGGPVGSGFTIAEADTAEDVRAWAAAFDPACQLAGGGADFFEALLRRQPARRAPPAVAVRRPLLYVSGTASAGSAAMKTTLAAAGRLLRMPDAIYAAGHANAAALDAWADAAAAVLSQDGEAMLAIDRQAPGRPDRAAALHDSLTSAAARVLSRTAVRTVACEGGATAAALCERLGWRQFTVDTEVAPGVVALHTTAAGPRLIVKPGSYPWPRV